MNKHVEMSDYGCLIIGDEILNGRITESNLAVLISHLLPRGYVLKEVRMVPDEPETISLHLTEMRKKLSFVVTMGGLGATHDDRTMESYALSFDEPLVVHQDMHDFFLRKPRPTEQMQKSVRAMSTMPKRCELILLDDTWPLIKLENCFALPGLPSICLFTIKKLASILTPLETIYYAVCNVRIKEHEYFMWLEDYAKQFTSVSIGSYPIDESQNILSKISVTGKDHSISQKCFDGICQYMQEHQWLISQETSSYISK